MDQSPEVLWGLLGTLLLKWMSWNRRLSRQQSAARRGVCAAEGCTARGRASSRRMRALSTSSPAACACSSASAASSSASGRAAALASHGGGGAPPSDAEILLIKEVF